MPKKKSRDARDFAEREVLRRCNAVCLLVFVIVSYREVSRYDSIRRLLIFLFGENFTVTFVISLSMYKESDTSTFRNLIERGCKILIRRL